MVIALLEWVWQLSLVGHFDYDILISTRRLIIFIVVRALIGGGDARVGGLVPVVNRGDDISEGLKALPLVSQFVWG